MLPFSCLRYITRPSPSSTILSNGYLTPHPHPTTPPHSSHFNNDPRLLALPWPDLFYTPGLPPKPTYDTTALASPSLALADAWFDKGEAGAPSPAAADPFPQWPTIQRQIFLERLLARAEKEGKPMPVPVLEAMDARYALSATRNAEIRFRWAVLCLRAGACFLGWRGGGCFLFFKSVSLGGGCPSPDPFRFVVLCVTLYTPNTQI